MQAYLLLILILALSYLIGSLAFAVIISKIFGLADPRSYGSGNPGATNVLRSNNKLAAALTLLGDASKGLLAMWLTAVIILPAIAYAPGQDFYLRAPASMPGLDSAQLLVAGAGLAAFIGHLFPLFLRFKGGKGVATALGVLLWLDYRIALAAALSWLATLLISRYSSLSALVAAALAPILALYWHGAGVTTLTTLIMSLLLIFRHKANIARLCAGTESRVGRKKAA